MGLVKLPAKKDYWKQGGVWPAHSVTSGMSRDRFHYIWQNFHVSYVSNNNNDNNMPEQDENDNLVDDFFGHVGNKDDENDGMEEDVEWTADDIPDRATETFTESKDVGCDDEYLSSDAEVQTWFHKVEHFLDHVNTVSKGLVDKLSDFLSLDEMMKLFKGRSSQTHMMKNKPIKKGFKFWAIACPVSGFIYRFVPSGRLENNKIYDVVNEMADSLPGMDTREDTEDTNYVLVMDNYFTLARAIGESRLQGKSVGVVIRLALS